MNMLENASTLFESKHWRAVLHKDQTYLGRAIIVSKSSRAALSVVTGEEWEDLRLHVIQPYESAVKNSFGATMFNWACLMNLAYQNDPPNPQVHWHVRPRYRVGAVVMGEYFDDPNFGQHYAFPTDRTPSETVMQEIARQIQTALSK
jgi:diadenosine tetraphosphate (Ap4A) HIT family hydrolase